MRPVLDLSLYMILGPSHLPGDPVPFIRAAVAGGVTLVQWRDKTSTTGAMIDQVRAIRQALTGTGVPLIVNDRVDVALAAGADGVHVGRDDIGVQDARRLLGPHPLLGVTVKNPAETRAVDPAILDYTSIGGVFKTDSKRNPDPPIGLDGLRDLVAILEAGAPGLPRCAIAGIGAEQAEPVIAAGVDGICVVSALTGSGDPEAAARHLHSLVERAKRRQERAFA